jgi:hypothetical protein
MPLIIRVACALLVWTSVTALPVQAQNGPYELPDNYLCYKSKVSKFNPSVKKAGLTAALVDQFDNSDYTILKERGLCLPASVDGITAEDEATHLTPYQVKTTKGAAKHTKQTGVVVVSEFGTVTLDTKKEDRLLIPASLNPSGGALPAPLFGLHGIDHYKCYKAKETKGTPKFSPAAAAVSDQFESSRNFGMKKVKLLCMAVDKDGTGVKSADGHLLCLQAKPAKGEPKHTKRNFVYTNDSLIGHFQDTTKEDLLCVPALVNPPAEFCGDGSVNQAETCETDVDCVGAGEVCAACACTQCGNGVIDGGETCETDGDCAINEECSGCNCAARGALGTRVLSLGTTGGMFSSLAGGAKFSTPTGSLTLEAGVMDASGDVAVTLAVGGPFYSTIYVQPIDETLCTEYSVLTGTMHCAGGVNVDIIVGLDSLAPGAGACVQDGTGNCDGDPGDVCCSNACEGVGVGSGNSEVVTTGVNLGDSGVGAALLEFTTRVATVAGEDIDCSAVDYSSEAYTTQVFTTGAATTQITNHCAGTAAPADSVPAFSKSGEVFDCLNWSLEDYVGAVATVQTAEEPSGLITGDGAQAIVLDDD